MSNLTYDQQNATKHNRTINREVQRYFGEKESDAGEFKRKVDAFRKSQNLEPIYEKEDK